MPSLKSDGGHDWIVIGVSFVTAASVAVLGAIVQLHIANQADSSAQRTLAASSAIVALYGSATLPQTGSPVALQLKVENDGAKDADARGCSMSDSEETTPLPRVSTSEQPNVHGTFSKGGLSYPAQDTHADFNLGPGENLVFRPTYLPKQDGTVRIFLNISCHSFNTNTKSGATTIDVVTFDGRVVQVQGSPTPNQLALSGPPTG